MRERGLHILQASFPLAWLLVIVLLPISSMPLIARLAGSDMVAAPSALPLIWLVVFWLIPYLFKRGTLAFPTAPFWGFVLVAILSSLAAYFLATPNLKNQSIFSREAKQLFTLAVGVCFYLVASTWPASINRLRTTLRWINYSGLVMLAWSLTQVYFTFVVKEYPAWMVHIQENLISVSGLFLGRTTGFAFEPSWLAHQLNMLYLPIWIAASLVRYSAHRFKFLGISLENILLAGGLAAMFFSYSRIGWLGLGLVAAFLLLKANIFLINLLRDLIQRNVSVRPGFRLVFTGIVTGLIALVFLAGYLGGIYGVARLGSQKDPRIAALFETPAEFSYYYINQLRFAERAVYWAAGWNIFNDHPILGVGIGNAGFYFRQSLPPFSWQLKEITDIMNHSEIIPNTKSLWTRILAETGLVGFSFFLAWCFLLFQTGRGLWKQKDPLLRVVGMAGMVGVVALIAEGFSVDSFALPYLWIMQGLVTAAGQQIWVTQSPTSTAPTHLDEIPAFKISKPA
ncbi:MAG TPA: O-antigen ligase family protein [Anaerolineaceae bacterium]|nr:O-antigen ligase family protein [Anaerolineaceae bacterium]